MKDWQWVLRPGEFNGAAYTVITGSGKDSYGKTEDDYRAEGFTVVSDEEFDDIVKEYTEKLCGDWTEITEEQYEEMLNVLPPLYWYSGGFFISEAYYGTLHTFCQKYEGKYYESLQSIFTSREKIIESLKAFKEKSDGKNQ